MDAEMEKETETRRQAAVAAGGGVGCGGGGAESVLSLAGAGDSVSLRYHPAFGPHDDVILLEAADELLADILRNRVTIRGSPDEEAVLCTQSTTYAMKFVGTSNSVFLIPPGEPDPASLNQNCSDGEANNAAITGAVASVIKVAPGSIELVQTAPKLDKLKHLLEERPYILDEDLGGDLQCKKGLYTWRDLCETVQASDGELRDGLKSLSAVEIDGFWRVVDAKSMSTILDMILHNSVLHDWPLHAMPESELLSVLKSDGFAARVVIHCLDTFGSRVEETGRSCWSLDEKRVCLQFAKRALGGGKMKLESFMEKWTRRVPSGMCADLQMLEGEVLYEKLGAETWVHALSAADLPLTPAERFAALFRARQKWEWKDLQPYIRDLRVPGVSLEGLLIKYTRRTQPRADAAPIFSAR